MSITNVEIELLEKFNLTIREVDHSNYVIEYHMPYNTLKLFEEFGIHINTVSEAIISPSLKKNC